MSWPMVKLGEIFTISRGGSPRPIQDYITDSSDGVNWIMIGDTEPNSKYIKKTAKKIKLEGVKKSRKVYSGDLLLTNSMSFGRPYILNVEGCIHDGWLVLSPKNDQINIDYFYHYLNSATAKIIIENKAAGAVVKNLNSDIVRNLEVPFPPITEQIKIASTLDKADNIRQKRNQAIKLADDFLHAAFLEMFGDPVSNPKGWKVKPLKELSVKIASGSTPKGGSKVYVDKGITFFRSQNVWKNDIRLDDVAYIDEKTHNSLKKSSLKHKDILMTKTGRFNTENSSLGRAALFLGDDDSANVNGHVYLIRLKSGILHEFITYILTSNEYREHIREVCVGGIDKRQLNKEHIEDFPIICPPDDLQMEFMRKLNSIQKIRSNAMTGLKEVTPLFNTLSQKAFSDGF